MSATFDVADPPHATLLTAVRHAALSVHAGLRTRLYASGVALARRFSVPLTAAERRTVDARRQASYDLHVATWRRPGLWRIFRRLEREDLRTLPIFLWRAPFDVLRVRRGGDNRVRPHDDFPYPSYYLHAFHHQLNGNLSRAAARTYEWQIRWLFFGANRLMRQAVVDALPAGAGLEVLDLGCGTAAWLPQARLQGRLHPVVGVDLSPDYLDVARARALPRTQFVQRNAEELPLHWRDRFDVVVSIWLLHELPAAARTRVVAEMARVLRPGGRLLLMDAALVEDAAHHPDGEMLNENFASQFNEPHFMSYQRLDLPALLGDHGFIVERVESCYASRLIHAIRA